MADWLGAALKDYQPVEYPWRDDEPSREDVVEGDFLVVSDMAGSAPNRMVVVLDVEPERRCFFGAFVTNERALPSSTHANYRDVEMTPYGNIEEWPRGFFDQAAEEERAIILGGLKKRRNRAARSE